MSTKNVASKHIVFVSMHTSPLAAPGSADAGGMNVVEYNAALALAKLGFKVDLITRRDAAVRFETRVNDSVRVFALPVGPMENVAKSEQEQFIEPFRSEFVSWLAEYGQDVSLIHSQHWFSGMVAMPVCKARGIPHVQSFHSLAAPTDAKGLDAGEPAESSGRIAGEKLLATHSDLIVAVSEYEKDTLATRYGTDPEHVDVVYPGVDLETFRPIQPGEPHWEWQGCYLLFAGRLQPLKAPDLAINVLAEFGQDSNLRLVIAGESSKDFARYSAELKQLTHEFGLTERVLFLGSQERNEFARMMRGACVLLNPSYSETFGLINLEAAASGVPVVATRTSGIVESVQDGVTGILIDSRKPSRWAEAIRCIIDDPKTRENYASRARKAAEHRSWDVVASELATSYAGLR